MLVQAGAVAYYLHTLCVSKYQPHVHPDRRTHNRGIQLGGLSVYTITTELPMSELRRSQLTKYTEYHW